MIRFAGVSDIGLIRKENQDQFLIGYNAHRDFLAIVCDGVGGANGGKLASEKVATLIFEQFQEAPLFTSSFKVKQWIIHVCQKANDALLKIVKDYPYLNGMATTVAGVIVSNQGTFVFNAGDSRVYGLFDKFLCLTQDHTYERFLKERGKEIVVDENVRKDALSNAIGIYSVVEIDIIKIKNNWKKLLICSDGVHNSITIYHILKILMNKSEPEIVCNLLVEEANLHGGQDNITAVIIERIEHNG